MELWRLKFMSIFFAAAFMLVVAIRLSIDQMFLMSGILVSIPVVSYIMGHYALRKATVRRSAPVACSEGETLRVEIILEGANELMRNLLVARDVVPEWLPIKAIIPDLSRPGYLTEEIVPRRRGLFLLESVEITSSDPLGLFFFHHRIPKKSELLVYPMPISLSEVLLGREARSGREMQTSLSRRGDATEMHSTREYQFGDELRRIHWPSTARAGHFVVMEREEPSDRTTWIALDLLKGSEKGVSPNNSLDIAARLAAAAARDALSEGEAVALLLPGMKESFLPPDRGIDHYYQILNRLATAVATAEISLGETLAAHASGARSRLLFFTASPDASLMPSLRYWLLEGGSVTGVLLDSSVGDSSDTIELEEFVGVAESMGASVHRVSLDNFAERHLQAN